MTEPVGQSLVTPYLVGAGPFERTVEDAARSIARYLALYLGDEWEVRYEGEEHTFVTPFARVEALGGAALGEGVYYHTVTKPFNVYAYPAYDEGPNGSIEESRIVAARVEQQLIDSLAIGGVDGARPMRVPFYNYNGIPLDTGNGSSFRTPYDYLRIVRGSVSTEQVPDPTDTRWITVVLGFRAMWFRRGEQILGKPVESVQTEINPSFSG